MSTKRIAICILIASILMLSIGDHRSTIAAAPAIVPPAVLSNEIVISSLNNSKYLPAVAYNSIHNEYLVVWENNWPSRDIYAQRISSQGELLSWFTVVTGAGSDTYDRAQPSVAYDPVNDRYLVVFIHDVFGNGSDWDIGGRFIPWNGPSPSLVEFPICQWNSSQWNPVVTYALAQSEFMVVWANTPSGQPAYISAARLSVADGSVLDDFTVSAGTENRINPDIAYNLARNEYLVTWDKVGTSHDISGQRLTAVGSALGSEIVLAGWPDNEESPSVAACNQADQYLVTWQSLVNPPTDYDIYGRFVQGDGSLGGVYLVDGTSAPEQNPDVACSPSGREYLIAWQTMYADGYYGIWARLANPDESMEDSFGLVQSGDHANRTRPAVAGGRPSYLAIWEHQRDGTTYQDIHGRLIWSHMLYLPMIQK